MVEHRVEVIRVVLHRREEGQASKVRQTGAMNRRPKTQIAQLLEAFLGRHTLILLEGVVPRLGRTGKMI
jgi:hypothetical protein